LKITDKIRDDKKDENIIVTIDINLRIHSYQSKILTGRENNAGQFWKELSLSDFHSDGRLLGTETKRVVIQS